MLYCDALLRNYTSVHFIVLFTCMIYGCKRIEHDIEPYKSSVERWVHFVNLGMFSLAFCLAMGTVRSKVCHISENSMSLPFGSVVRFC